MWSQTAISQLMRLRWPIIQGPFGGGLSSIDLTVAVAEAGGLGSFGVHHLAHADIVAVAKAIRARTQKAFALNLWMPVEGRDQHHVGAQEHAVWQQQFSPYFAELGVTMPNASDIPWPTLDAQLAAVLDAKPTVFSFVFGIPPASMLKACRDAGIITCGTATTVAEAQRLEQAGVDCVVATGFEAGGHRVSFLRDPADCLTGTLALIPQVVDAVKVPVIAAGGIADARGVAAALALGAQGVQIGTAFLACEESNASAVHKQKLFTPEAHDTALTRAFSGRLARGISNRLLREQHNKQASLPGYPAHTWFMSHLKNAAIEHQRDDLMALWCGQSAALLKHHRAAELMASLTTETTALLQGFAR